MEQIRPFPPTDFIDQAEEEEAIRLIPGVAKTDLVPMYATIDAVNSFLLILILTKKAPEGAIELINWIN